VLTISLFRHAKSSWDDPQAADFARPLAARGRAAAPRMAAVLMAEHIEPDLVLCSTAVRTRETLALVRTAFSSVSPVILDDALYHASEDALLARVRGIGFGFAHVLIIGHNPGLAAFARLLVGQATVPVMGAALGDTFPTAGLAVIDFAGIAAWAEIAAGAGVLRLFATPGRADG
jgi:phosphohistidine phosphatase